MWIPLDILLTVNITLYQVFHNYTQDPEDDLLDEDDKEDTEEQDDIFYNKLQ